MNLGSFVRKLVTSPKLNALSNRVVATHSTGSTSLLWDTQRPNDDLLSQLFFSAQPHVHIARMLKA